LDELDAVHKDIEETSKAIAGTGRDITQDVRGLEEGLRAWQTPSADVDDSEQRAQDQAPGTDASDG
jgi:hypothetical protein